MCPAAPPSGQKRGGGPEFRPFTLGEPHLAGRLHRGEMLTQQARFSPFAPDIVDGEWPPGHQGQPQGRTQHLAASFSGRTIYDYHRLWGSPPTFILYIEKTLQKLPEPLKSTFKRHPDEMPHSLAKSGPFEDPCRQDFAIVTPATYRGRIGCRGEKYSAHGPTD